MSHIRSIRYYLLSVVLIIVVMGSLIAAVMNYLDAKEQVEEVLDAELAQMAKVLQSLFSSQLPAKNAPPSPLIYEDFFSAENTDEDEEDDAHEITPTGHKYEKKLAFQAWLPNGQLMLQSRSARDNQLPPFTRGYHSIQLNDKEWRLFTLISLEGYSIQVAQRQDVRTELTDEIAEHMFQAPLMITAIIALFLWIAIGYAFQPLRKISMDVAERNFGNLAPIDPTQSPSEIREMVSAINTLFHRVKAQAAAERRFTADAAHELRTPLAALKVQLQNAKRRVHNDKAEASLQKALNALDRMIHLVEQLLLLSRLDATQAIDLPETVSINQTVEHILEDYDFLLADKQVLLSWQSDQELRLQGHPALLYSLIKNFVDNALRYTPKGGTLGLRLHAHALTIEDSGPGIPENQLPNVFQRFYRVEGDQSQGEGLGLAVCQKIAELYRFHLTLRNRAAPDSGLQVTINFSPE